MIEIRGVDGVLSCRRKLTQASSMVPRFFPGPRHSRLGDASVPPLRDQPAAFELAGAPDARKPDGETVAMSDPEE